MTIEPNRMFSGLDRCGHTLTRLSFLHWKTTESRVTCIDVRKFALFYTAARDQDGAGAIPAGLTWSRLALHGNTTSTGEAWSYT